MVEKRERATAVEVDSRVSTVAELLVRGRGRKEICEYMREITGASLSDSQVDRYISKARESLRARTEEEEQTRGALVERRFSLIYSLALEKGDLRTALAATKEMAALLLPRGEASQGSDLKEVYGAMRAYAGVLRRVVPPDLLRQVMIEVEDTTAPPQMFAEDVDKSLERCVRDVREFGSAKTYEELCAEGFRS